MKDVFSEAFIIPKNNIEVLKGLTDLSSTPENIQISIGTKTYKGDFPFYTEIIVLDPVLVSKKHLPIFQKISIQVSSRLLLPEGGGISPYIWTIIENGDTRLVKLVPDLLDKEREELVIESYL